MDRASSPDGRALPRPKQPIKRYRRFRNYDYSRGAALFLTVSTSPRADLFGRVVEAKMELSPLGAEVLEIAEGNEPTDFSRAACLDLNAAIIPIATSGEGVAVYWKEHGPAVIGQGGACPSGLPASTQS